MSNLPRLGAVFVLWILLVVNHAEAFVRNKSFLSPHVSSRGRTRMMAKWTRRYFEDEDGAREQSRERPTLPSTEVMGTPVQPSKPKIVVLGASGKVGSLIVRQLLEMSELDATIVAFVRDYDKACRVLYDDIMVVRNKRKGPQLQIVVGDLVPPEELPGYKDEDEEQLWLERAESAADFYGTKTDDYDNREHFPDANEALQEAIKGCTTIISCVGSVRPTNIWSDFVVMPFWRLFRHDVSGWCRDPRHPYYVHYAQTRKVLGYAEREQLRREAVIEALAAEKENNGGEPQEVQRIRFIRLSDLCVTQRPWEFIPLLTNALQSMVFRYQDMTERLLEESKVLETVILRPGDLVDEDRDVNTTSLQVDASGRVPTPARVGRDDVAELAIAAALFQSVNVTKVKPGTPSSQTPPLHLTLGIRWVGTDLSPYPAQGRKRDGLVDAQLCMNRVLKDHRKALKRKRRRQLCSKSSTAHVPESVVRFVKHRRRRLKPYGIYVAIPVYFLLAVAMKNLCCHIPGIERVASPIARVRDTVGAAVMARMPPMRTWLRKLVRKGGKSYISF